MTEDEKLQRLIRAAHLTNDVEIDCSTCLELVPAYVDAELAGADPAQTMADVQQHLALCTDCFEEYEALRAIAQLDATGSFPSKDELLRQLRRRHAGPDPLLD